MAELMKHTDLCSGIGGFALGFEWAGLSRPVMFCDIEPWSRKVLAKHWPDVPIAEDVKELASDPTRLVPDCDILTSGYPCQPFSVAGKQRGAEDDRHIWPQIFTIVQAKRPNWCVFENVSGHISLGLDEVLSDLEAEGYAVQPFVVPACAVDAPHRRDRVWIVANSSGLRRNTGGAKQSLQGFGTSGEARWEIAAHANSHGEPDGTINEQRLVGNTSRGRRSGNDRRRSGQELANRCEDVADTDSAGCKEQWRGQPAQAQHEAAKCGDWWSVEPSVGRVANGIPKRLDRFDGWERELEDIPRVATGVKDRVNRLKGLGNAILPQIAMQIGLTIKAVRDG